MRNQFIVTAVGVLAGCQSSSHAIIFKPGVNMPATVAAADQCKIASFKDIPQSMATQINPGVHTSGTMYCNTIGQITSCNEVGGLNIPATATTYDVNQELRDRYLARCLQAQGFTVEMNGRTCTSESEERQAYSDRMAGRFPKCSVRFGF